MTALPLPQKVLSPQPNSNLLQVHAGKGGAHNLKYLLGESFHSFGIPETLTSDQDPQYTAEETQQFLRCPGIHHRKTSVGFSHANQKAERNSKEGN